jgi:hypothetical protein
VTIAIGFHCEDGVVLCADRQLSSENWHKFEESKMYATLDAEDKLAVVLSYCGDPHTIKTLHQKMMSSPIGLDSPEAIQNNLESVLSEFPQAVVDQTEVLCGFTIRGIGYGLLRTKGSLVHAVPYDFVGAGDSSLVRFLSSLLIPSRIGFRIGIGTAVLLGNYIVSKAKEFVEGCGGPTDICVLNKNGTLSSPWFTNTKKANEAEKAIESDIHGLIFELASGGSQSKVDAFWDALRNRVRDFPSTP